MNEPEHDVGRDGDRDEAFEALIHPYLRRLQLHCYLMLGSVQDAEDALQETLVRAWRRFDQFSGRSQFGTWLYAIATRVCLDGQRRRRRRLHPRDLCLGHNDEGPWVEPYPDWLLPESADSQPGPLERVVQKEHLTLAFVASVQALTPRQRAVLLLRDVMGWSARETAEWLDMTETAVNSALHRARTGLQRYWESRPNSRHALAPVPDDTAQLVVHRYLTAWQAGDIATLATLLREDTILTMPPLPRYFVGLEAVVAFFAASLMESGRPFAQLEATWANGQPALLAFQESAPRRDRRVIAAIVMTIVDGHITEHLAYTDPRVIATFDASQNVGPY